MIHCAFFASYWLSILSCIRWARLPPGRELLPFPDVRPRVLETLCASSTRQRTVPPSWSWCSPSRKTARYWIGSGGPVGWASCRRPSSCGCHCASYLPGGCCRSSLLVDAGRGRESAAGLGRAQGVWVVRNPRARLFSSRDHCCSCCCCCCRCRDGHCQVQTRSGLGVD